MEFQITSLCGRIFPCYRFRFYYCGCILKRNTNSRLRNLNIERDLIRGKIEIVGIKEIIIGKSLWSGFKPATAKNGLIIKYDKYNEIYISPKPMTHSFKEYLN